MDTPQNLPSFRELFPDLDQFILHLVDLYKEDRINSWDDLDSQVKAFFTPSRMGQVEAAAPGWQKMASYAEGVTLVHVMCVFLGMCMLRDGEWLEINADTASYDEISRAYINQVEYISREILTVVDVLESESDVPPVIILQGDHGPPPDLTNDPAIKMPILNAYSLPGVDQDQALYPSISPVNSFRVVLSRYFGAHLPLLEDLSYFAPNQDHERIGLFPNLCP